MTLRQYMDKMNIDIYVMSKTFGVSVHAVKKWLRGDRIPRDKMKAKIAKVTKGAVSGNDWVPND